LTSAFALSPALYGNVSLAAETGPSQAATAAQLAETVDEIVVTGTRIIREGYAAPTPLSVIDKAALENRADPNLAVLIAEMPAFSGNGPGSTNSTSLGQSGNGQSNVNLRNLGALRTLVLLDGYRTVGSSASGQNVDISSYPQQLVSRVEVVTGGASAVYGSDAVAGVVNFILDKKFNGVKADVSTGVTSYGDGANYSVKMSGGFGFAGGRGHVLLSGETERNFGSDGDGGRAWNREGVQVFTNPTYTATNGEPNLLLMSHVGITGGTNGGIVVSAGALKGVAFGQGGLPYQFQLGTLTNASQTVGGDWETTDRRMYFQMIQNENRQNLFGRVDYDLNDNVQVFAQSFWTSSSEGGVVSPGYRLNATGPIIKIDNAYLPASVKAAMTTAKLTQIQIGTWNADMGPQIADNLRVTNQNIVGAKGKFDSFGKTWNWDVHGSYGVSKPTIRFYNSFGITNYNKATDAVVNPLTGAIVCRVKLTNAADPCSPWNPLGVGVNASNSAGLAYMQQGGSYSKNEITQKVYAASITGEPFSVPAGPVSVAISGEHRTESVLNQPDALSVLVDRNAANISVLEGQQSVSEAALETVVPILRGLAFAQNLDINAAARYTNYELAGQVTTWKVGATFSPIDDLRFRVTRSRDIRAPNLQELFQPSAFSVGTVKDPFTNTQPTSRTITSGNAQLLPEKADTLGVGVVVSPRFLDGFTASVDYWEVKLQGGIGTVATQKIIDYCYNGVHPEFCPSIIRVNGAISQVNGQYINIAGQEISGVDVEASYKFQVEKLFSSWQGGLSLHTNASFYLHNYQDDHIAPVSDHVGENNGSSGPPKMRLTATATYQLDPISLSLTARAVTPGTLNSEYIECTTGCPTSTADHYTISDNHLPGMVYLDVNARYNFQMGSKNVTAYFSAKNIFNRDPPAIGTSSNYGNLALGASALYDVLGSVYRLGLRTQF
jgi:outer membrane receptor protein involved in Fe transport